MSLADVTVESVFAAIAEYDHLGRDVFLSSHGFRRSRKYVIVLKGRTYESKAIVGVAHRFATGQALPAAAFSGGDQTVVARLQALGFDVRDSTSMPDDKIIIGEVPGVAVGAQFVDRETVRVARVHRAGQAGITGTGVVGAESIVVSGGYEDDEDQGDMIIYTGHGGRDATGRQVTDQLFTSPGNAALLTSMLSGAPVRVVRGAHRDSPHAPETGYRYDGLFRVEDAWRERGRSGFLMCRYRMVAFDSSLLVAHAPAARESEPGGTDSPERRAATVNRLVRSIQVAAYVKSVHDHVCQVCATRLTIGDRGYSEGAHIRALGRPHDGPDVPANMLCLCPNCHVLFDNGALVIDGDLAVRLNGAEPTQLRSHPNHAVDRAHLEYHRSVHQ